MRILDVLTPKRLRGNLGERAAVRYLKKNGYRILKRNFVIDGVGEIDVVAAKDGHTVIVEVKTRSKASLRPWERPALSVTKEKQQRLLTAGSVYHSRYARDTRLRFDVIEVYTDSVKGREHAVEVRHLVGAFDGSVMKERGKHFRAY